MNGAVTSGLRRVRRAIDLIVGGCRHANGPSNHDAGGPDGGIEWSLDGFMQETSARDDRKHQGQSVGYGDSEG